jgi:hypothetical protein
LFASSTPEVHDDEYSQFLVLPRLLLVFFFEIVVLLDFVVEEVPHDRVEGLLGAVGLDLLDCRVEDGVFYFFGEPVAEGVVRCGDVLDGADVGDVATCWENVQGEVIQ